MPEDPTNERLSNRLADLRSLGDRQRAFHPVSVLRQELSAAPTQPAAPESPVTPVTPEAAPPRSAPPSLDERARTLARRVFSSLLSRAERQAQRILHERRSSVSEMRRKSAQLRQAPVDPPPPPTRGADDTPPSDGEPNSR